MEVELERRYGAPEAIKNRKIHTEILDILRNAMSSLSDKMRLDPETDLSDLPGSQTDPTYLQRVAEVAGERLRGGPDAPSIRISPRPASPDALQGVNFGLLFGAETIYFQDTVLALETDEVVSRSEGDPRINVLGVRADWWTEDGRGTRRALLTDETGRVEEVGFKEPLPLDIVQTLHLPRVGERSLHREISCACERAGIEQLNPYATSRRADDKAWTHRLWAARGISSPACCVIPRQSGSERILSFLSGFLREVRHSDIVLQPNAGTEGAGVERFRIEPNDLRRMGATHPAVRYARSLASSDDILVRETRGSVRFRSPEGRDRGYRNVTFRINVSWNGTGFVAESGYAQVARDEKTFPASRGRGGEIVDLGNALLNLWRRGPRGWERLILREEEIDRIQKTAVEAVEALHTGLDREAYLKLIGVDILLEVDHKALLPIALEANPRPAGLAQSVEIPAGSNGRGKPKVSVGLFQYIRTRFGFGLRGQSS